ncbi:MAG: hypothetical protein IJ153_10590 [Clostridia bacterium]|nr:hypothetical protein [Clostridia bacterium]
MSRKQNRVIENQTLLDNMRKIQKASGLRQGAFFNQYLKGLPGAPTANTDAAADVALSEIMNGSRPVPVSFLPVYARLGQISVDRLLTGQDWSPEERPATYGDVLQLLSDLLSKRAASIQSDGSGISLQDPALVSMLAALGNLDRLQRDGFLSAVGVQATLSGLLQREELQTPLFDGSSASAAQLRKITAEAVQQNEESALDKMLRLIRCTAPRKVSK